VAGRPGRPCSLAVSASLKRDGRTRAQQETRIGRARAAHRSRPGGRSPGLRTRAFAQGSKKPGRHGSTNPAEERSRTASCDARAQAALLRRVAGGHTSVETARFTARAVHRGEPDPRRVGVQSFGLRNAEAWGTYLPRAPRPSTQSLLRPPRPAGQDAFREIVRGALSHERPRAHG